MIWWYNMVGKNEKKSVKEDKKQAVKAEGIAEEQAPEAGVTVELAPGVDAHTEGEKLVFSEPPEADMICAKVTGTYKDPQEDEARELRIRARTVKLLPMAYRIDEKVVQAWRGYVLKECGSQLGAGPLLEEILREYLPTHGFPIGEA
jgi:hypothetical protein